MRRASWAIVAQRTVTPRPVARPPNDGFQGNSSVLVFALDALNASPARTSKSWPCASTSQPAVSEPTRLTGQNLVRALSELYIEHNMAEHDSLSRIRTEAESEGVPRIICSEALV
jgi:hypothetical protein